MNTIDRRELIKKSVVAGGLVWTAPTILASPASAQTPPCTECANDGILYYVHIPSGSAANCGENGDCGTRADWDAHPQYSCGECLFDDANAIDISAEYYGNSGNIRVLTVTIDARLRLVEAVTKFRNAGCAVLTCENSYADYGTLAVPPYFYVKQNRVPPVPPTAETGTPMIIEAIGRGTASSSPSDTDPVNEMALVVCFEAGGTDFPGC